MFWYKLAKNIAKTILDLVSILENIKNHIIYYYFFLALIAIFLLLGKNLKH